MGSKTISSQTNTEKNKETAQETRADLNNNEISKLLSMVVEEMDNNIKNKEGFNGIKSGFEKLDLLLQGFREGDLNIIASRPAIGKTTFALSMFVNIVMQGNNALYVSFDKYENELLKNILSIMAKINKINIDTGFLTKTDYKKIIDGLTQLYNNNGNVFLKTFYNTDLIKLKEFIKEKVEKDKIKIVFIDYLTLIKPAPTYTNRWEQVAEISRSLKSMAMEFKIPFIVLCPIHRNIIDNTPDIADISESGSIEYDADRVIILHRKQEKKKYNDDSSYVDRDNTRITAYIAKNRHGSSATFDMLFNYNNKTIEDAKKDST
jgi:replicative DNA helicase